MFSGHSSAFIKEELQDAKLLQEVANMAAAAAQTHVLQPPSTANGALSSLASPLNPGQPPLDSIPLLNAFNMPATSVAPANAGNRRWQAPAGGANTPGNATPVTSHGGKAAGARGDPDSPPQEAEIITTVNNKVGAHCYKGAIHS